jgi:hypothetical protein
VYRDSFSINYSAECFTGTVFKAGVVVYKDSLAIQCRVCIFLVYSESLKMQRRVYWVYRKSGQYNNTAQSCLVYKDIVKI